MKRFTSILFFASLSFFCFAQRKTENVILITMDGLRWQEVFSGAEKQLITDKAFVSDSARLANKFWSEDASKRRELLLPFFWSVIGRQGQLYGNRLLGNKVSVSNNQWFSYPGYNEILTGFADNDRIHSNDKFDNPNKNVLEFLNQQKGFQGKVAAYSSWDVFPYIINAKRNGIPVNSGIVEAKNDPTEYEKFLNELMFQVPNPLGEVRLDAFTFHYAMEYLKKNKPHVLYISFDETDDFAHGGKYDLYLEAAHYIDGFIKTLWDFVQHSEGYKGKTTLIITTDHGRGHLDKDAWRHHGSKVQDADQIWIAFLGPDTPSLGEIKTEGQLYQNQIAKTLSAFLGFNYSNERPVGEVIQSVLKK
jgi:Type I phosphodiesterase / nucleotide pyrophosphatase